MLIVLQAGISPEYFFDKMQWCEIPVVLQHLEYKEKISWEQTRVLAYIIAQSHSAKKIKPEDILKFGWDNISVDTSIKTEDIERLKKKAEQYLKSKLCPI